MDVEAAGVERRSNSKLTAGEVIGMSAGPCVATAVAESSQVAGNWLSSRLTGDVR